MKGPNGKSILLNRATVSISSTIYDRRALDCTDDKALVNSLNHLTFLTSSSIKVRDAMIQDGAVERLVGILYECKDPKTETESIMFAWKWVLSLQCLVLAGTRGSEKMRKKLVDAGIIPILATILDNHFLTKKNAAKNDINPNQSSSNSSSNNSNNINNNNTNNDNLSNESNNDFVVDSNTNRNTTTNSNNEFNESNINSSNANDNNNHDSNDNFTQSLDPNVIITDDSNDNGISNILQQIRSTVNEADEIILNANEEIEKFSKLTNSDSINSNTAQRFLCDEERELLHVVELVKCLQKLGDSNISNNNIPKLMNEYFSNVILDSVLANELYQRIEVSNILSNYSDQIKYYKNTSKTLDPLSEIHTVPRSFKDGLILPTTDDVIWSLQLLAFISKYTYLRHSLSNTYLINGLSFRSRNTPPPLEVDTTSIDLDEFMTDLSDEPISNDESILSSSQIKFQIPNEYNDIPMNLINSSLLKQEERLLRLKKLSDDDDKGIVEDYFKILQTNNTLEKIRYLEKIRLSSVRLKHESLGKLRIKNKQTHEKKLKDYAKKWDYDQSWDEFETSLDVSELIDREIQPFVTLNIFPLVERFTVKTWFPEDICYWAAVVVRNANRKDEKMGGRRQCANFNCGIWEDHPKQFSKCRRCKRAKYCSRSCQTKAWIFHKHWCVPAITPTTSSDSQENASGASNNNDNHNHNHNHSHNEAHEHNDNHNHNHNHNHEHNHANGNAMEEDNVDVDNNNVHLISRDLTDTPITPITGNTTTSTTTAPSTSSIGPQTIASTDSSVSVSGITNADENESNIS